MEQHVETAPERRVLVVDRDLTSADHFGDGDGRVALARDGQVPAADVLLPIAVEVPGRHDDIAGKLTLDLGVDLVHDGTIQVRIEPIGRAQVEAGRGAELVELRDQVAVAIGPSPRIGRPNLDRVDAADQPDANPRPIPIGGEFERGAAVAEEVVDHPEPRRQIQPIRRVALRKTLACDEDRLFLARGGEPLGHVLQAQSDIEGQLADGCPPILNVDRVLGGVVLGVHRVVERLNRVRRAVAVARDESCRIVRQAIGIVPVVVAVELIPELDLVAAGVGKVKPEMNTGLSGY